MTKFIKYEIKGTYKFIMMLILAVLGASTGLQLSALKGLKGNFESLPPYLPLILGLIIFGAFISAFFYIVSSFRKELYEDRGYLTFSLPLTGKQMVGTKLLIALFWTAVIGLSMVIYNLLLGSILFGTQWIEEFKVLFSSIPFGLEITVGITGILSATLSLLLIYFSITLSKVSIRNRKIGGLWFILFLVLNATVNYLSLKVATAFPYYFDTQSFKIVNGTLFADIFGYGLNISSIVFSTLICIITFFVTSYLIDRKVEI